MQRERGVNLIIAYKLGKAGLWLVLATVIAVMTRMGLGADLLDLASNLRHHAGAWSLDLASLITRAATRRGQWTLVVALVADAFMSGLEGWALLHGHWWGPWLVVVSTGSLLPFEVVAFVRHPHAVRAVLFVLNLVIVAYLARKALREHGARASEARTLRETSETSEPGESVGAGRQ